MASSSSSSSSSTWYTRGVATQIARGMGGSGSVQRATAMLQDGTMRHAATADRLDTEEEGPRVIVAKFRGLFSGKT